LLTWIKSFNRLQDDIGFKDGFDDVPESLSCYNNQHPKTMCHVFGAFSRDETPSKNKNTSYGKIWVSRRGEKLPKLPNMTQLTCDMICSYIFPAVVPGRFFSKFLHQLQEVWPAYSEEAFRWDRAVQGSLVGRLRDPGPGVYNIALLCVHMFQYI
jgi:hypothetical protein